MSQGPCVGLKGEAPARFQTVRVSARTSSADQTHLRLIPLLHLTCRQRFSIHYRRSARIGRGALGFRDRKEIDGTNLFC